MCAQRSSFVRLLALVILAVMHDQIADIECGS